MRLRRSARGTLRRRTRTWIYARRDGVCPELNSRAGAIRSPGPHPRRSSSIGGACNASSPSAALDDHAESPSSPGPTKRSSRIRRRWTLPGAGYAAAHAGPSELSPRRPESAMAGVEDSGSAMEAAHLQIAPNLLNQQTGQPTGALPKRAHFLAQPTNCHRSSKVRFTVIAICCVGTIRIVSRFRQASGISHSTPASGRPFLARQPIGRDEYVPALDLLRAGGRPGRRTSGRADQPPGLLLLQDVRAPASRSGRR